MSTIQKQSMNSHPIPHTIPPNHPNNPLYSYPPQHTSTQPPILSLLPRASTSNAHSSTDRILKHTHRQSSSLRSLDFLAKLHDTNKQKYAIKAINHVDNYAYKPLVDSPAIVNYIIDAMKESNRYQAQTNQRKQRQREGAHILNHCKSKSKQNIYGNNFKSTCYSAGSSFVHSPISTPREGVQQNVSNQHNNHNRQTYKSYKVDPQRRKIQKLNNWLTQKLKQHKIEQKNSGTLITQRIHSLHLAFSETCRIAGKYSTQISQTLTNIHTQYHKMYQNLIECLMQQNLNVKKKNQQMEDKVNSIILHYEQQLLNIRIQYDKKSSKVIQNFHKCINMKQQFEEENKKLAKLLKNQRVKLNFMEEGLAKAINILIQIGDQKFKFLTTQQQKIIISLGLNYKSSPQNYRLFHKWCSTMLKIIANMKQSTQQNKKQKQKTQKQKQKQQQQRGKQKQNMGYQQHVKYLKRFALSAIGKFMIDFDSSLSIKDAEEMLLDFITHHSNKKQNQIKNISINCEKQNTEVAHNTKQQMQNNLNYNNKINIFQLHQQTQKNEIIQNNQLFQNSRAHSSHKKGRKNPMVLTVPNLHEISEKFKGVNAQVQVTTNVQCQSKAIQANMIQTAQAAVTAKPRQKTKETSTLPWLREKMNIYGIFDMDMYIWAERQIKIVKTVKNNEQGININQNGTNTGPASQKKSLKQTVSRKISVISALTGGIASRKVSKNIQPNISSIMTDLNQQTNKIKPPSINIKTIAEQQSRKQEQPDKKQTQINSNNNNININSQNSALNNLNYEQNNVIRTNKNLNKKKRDQSINKKVTFTKKLQQDRPKQRQGQKNPYQDSKLINGNIKNVTLKQGKSVKNIMKQTEDLQKYIKYDERNESMRKQKKTSTAILAINNRDIFQDFSSIDTIKNISKSVSYIPNPNQTEDSFSHQRRRGMIPKDLDMFIEDILTRRNAKKEHILQKQLQKQGNSAYDKYNRELAEKFGDKSMKKIGQIPKLDIHGHQMNIANVNNTKFQIPQQFQNLANQNTTSQSQDKKQTKQTIILDLLKTSKKNHKTQFLPDNQSPVSFQTHSHGFMMQFIEFLQQKNKKITQSTMWNHRKNQQIQKLIHKLHLSKQRMMPNSNNLQFMFACVSNYIDPIINVYLKMYTHLAQSQNILSSSQFKCHLMSGRRICYYHRLAPLLHVLINTISLSYFGIGKCTKYITTFYKGLKNLKNYDRRLQVYEQLIDGTSIQLDIFVRIAYYLSQNKSTHFQNQYIQLSVVELQMFFILDAYLTPGEINNLINQVRTSIDKSNSMSGEDKICLQALTIKVFKTISQKKNNLFKKYKPILQILGEQNQSFAFNDLLYFIQAFPADKQTRRKILSQTSNHIIYWQKKQPTIPQDRLIFLFESFRFISAQALEKNLIVEYFKMKCEKQYKSMYDKVLNNPDYVVESVYRLFYRVPPMLYRLTQQLKGNKACKKNAPILAVLYNMIMEDQIQKVYISGYLNAISGIPIPI